MLTERNNLVDETTQQQASQPRLAQDPSSHSVLERRVHIRAAAGMEARVPNQPTRQRALHRTHTSAEKPDQRAEMGVTVGSSSSKVMTPRTIVSAKPVTFCTQRPAPAGKS